MRRFAIAAAVAPVLALAGTAGAASSGWSIQHTPNPAGSTNSQLNGVSCASTSACTAAGNYSTSTTQVTLAERWKGGV